MKYPEKRLGEKGADEFNEFNKLFDKIQNDLDELYKLKDKVMTTLIKDYFKLLNENKRLKRKIISLEEKNE